MLKAKNFYRHTSADLMHDSSVYSCRFILSINKNKLNEFELVTTVRQFSLLYGLVLQNDTTYAVLS